MPAGRIALERQEANMDGNIRSLDPGPDMLDPAVALIEWHRDRKSPDALEREVRRSAWWLARSSAMRPPVERTVSAETCEQVLTGLMEAADKLSRSVAGTEDVAATAADRAACVEFVRLLMQVARSPLNALATYGVTKIDGHGWDLMWEVAAAAADLDVDDWEAVEARRIERARAAGLE